MCKVPSILKEFEAEQKVKLARGDYYLLLNCSPVCKLEKSNSYAHYRHLLQPICSHAGKTEDFPKNGISILPEIRIITYFCPCYIFGKNAEQLGESCVLYALSQFVPYLDWFCRAQVRGKIRQQRGIEGTCLKDCLIVGCCSLCALVQEARELKGAGPQSMLRE